MTEEQARLKAVEIQDLLEECIEEAPLHLKVKLLRLKILEIELLNEASKRIEYGYGGDTNTKINL